MPTFMCLLNWTEQGVKHAKDAGKRTKAAHAVAEKLERISAGLNRDSLAGFDGRHLRH
jgi:uncharacterized protein with GYD domain